MTAALPTLTLVRGHPGSGKTTYAQRLMAQSSAPMVHLENDQFFTAADGTYAFDFGRHEAAKQWCLETTRDALARGQSVVVSNTFTTRAELAPYVALGYPVEVVEMHLDFPNAHQVPEAVVAAKKAQFEPWEDALAVHTPTDEATDGLQARARKPRW